MSAEALRSAWARIRDGDPAGAQAILVPLVRQQPRLGEAHRLLGMSFRMLGRPEEAEAAFRAAINADNRNPLFHAEYAAFLEHAGRIRLAEREFRAALSFEPGFGPAASGLAHLLIDNGRPAEGAAVLRPFAAKPEVSTALLAVHARALQDAGEFDAAEQALAVLIARQPLNADAHENLAEIAWTRTGDRAAAISALDAAIAEHPEAVALRLAKAKVLTQTGAATEAAEEVAAALRIAPGDPALLAGLAQLSGRRTDAQAALAAAPQSREIKRLLAQACIQEGAPDEAGPLLDEVLEPQPFDQLALALQATAWRIMGDPRAAVAYDYDRTVFVQDLDTPKGWRNLSTYLADLAPALNALHAEQAHPFGQSVRGGSQVTVLGVKKPPAIAAIAKALEEPIRAAIGALMANGHPLGARATGPWRYTGMWSVRLAKAGYHDNHIHPDGWFSSACYVDLPELPGQEGWLKLGEPGLKLTAPLPAERFIEPAPGRLVLFPSYMWHGTVPFSADKPRLTFAFDFAPA